MTSAPLFSLPDASGKPWALEKCQSKYVLIYFYPKALTPGCTVQACALNDGLAALRKMDVEVAGISPDSPERLKAFVDKYALGFTLLGDENHAVCEAYGAWGPKTLYGKTYDGVKRCSFLIGPQREILHVWHNVNAKTHYDDVFTWIKANIANK